MKIKELKALIKNLPDDVIVMTKDHECNGMHHSYISVVKTCGSPAGRGVTKDKDGDITLLIG